MFNPWSSGVALLPRTGSPRSQQATSARLRRPEPLTPHQGHGHDSLTCVRHRVVWGAVMCCLSVSLRSRVGTEPTSQMGKVRLRGAETRPDPEV